MPYFHHFLAESTLNNKCCYGTGNNNGVIKQVKSGYLLHFKKKLFGKTWKEEFVVLYADSSLIWFRDRDRLDPEGGVFLKDAPEMLAAGQWTSRVPGHPEFPNGCTFHHSIAVGSRLRKDKVHWFLCKSDAELVDWMSAISHTLPPPPPPPEELRTSRKNLAIYEQLKPSPSKVLTPPPHRQAPPPDKRYALLKHQPSSPDILLGKMGRINLNSGSGSGPSSQHVSPSPSSGQFPIYSSLTEKSRSYSTGKMNSVNLDFSGGPLPSGSGSGSALNQQKPRVTFRDDVMAGVMMTGALTQWNAASSAAGSLFGGAGAFLPSGAGAAIGASGASVPWDWGMGWGWAGWTPEGAVSSSAYCGSCALEAAAAANHHEALIHPSGSGYNSSSFSASGKADFYYDDDHEIGELGETTDVACDFGGDFGGF